MIWLTWRLQRVELLLMSFVMLVVGGALVLSHDDIVATSKFYTAETCPGPLVGPELGCQISTGSIYQIMTVWVDWFKMLPLVTAVLLVLPIILELDSGVFRLAWTQSLTRRHWIGIKISILTLAGILFSALFSLVFSWWSSPRDHLNGRLNMPGYDLRGTMPVGYTLFAIGLILAIGVTVRRPVLAIIGSALVYLVVQTPIALWVRPHLFAAVTQSDAELYATPDVGNRWYLSSWWQDAAGQRYSDSQFVTLCDLTSSGSSRSTQEQCIVDHGLVHYQTYHPESHYWSLQFTETALFVFAGLLLIGFSAWYLLRRVE